MVWLVVKPQLDGVGCVVFASFRLTTKCLLTPFWGQGKAQRRGMVVPFKGVAGPRPNGLFVRLIATSLLVLILAQPVQADTQSPEGAMHSFYSWVIAHPSGTSPSNKECAHIPKR